MSAELTICIRLKDSFYGVIGYVRPLNNSKVSHFEFVLESIVRGFVSHLRSHHLESYKSMSKSNETLKVYFN